MKKKIIRPVIVLTLIAFICALLIYLVRNLTIGVIG